MALADFAAELERRIRASYAASGNTCGWRLLASPLTVLNGADVAFIGLNPGGSEQHADHGELAMDGGSAYVAESWKGYAPGNSPLQRQVRALFAGLDVEPEKVLAGNLVPFRSPDWDTLVNPDSSLAFGEEIWGEIFSRARPSLVVAMGGKNLAPLTRILGASKPTPTPVGWGKVTASAADFPGGRLVVLPHLSRFGIITRKKSKSALQELFGDRWHPGAGKA